ncbi:MAG: hypothetical protein ACK4ND_02855 [Cytophagaceae bacterium]
MSTEHIRLQTPKAYKDFLLFFHSELKNHSLFKNVSLEELPFTMQLGLYIKYFEDNGVALDLSNFSFEELPQVIMDAFESHEKIISHYS